MSLPAVYVHKRRLYMALLIVASLFQVVALISSALLVRAVIDTARGTAIDGQLYILFIGLLASSLALVALRLTARLLAEHIGQSYVHDVRIGLFESLMHSRSGLTRQASAGNMLLPFTGDLSALKRWVSLGLSGAIVSGIVLLLSLVALAFFSVTAALAAMLVMIAGISFNMVLSKPALSAVRRARSKRSRMVSNLSEKVTHPVVVSFFGRGGRETARHSRLSAELKDALIEKSRLSRLMRAATELSAIWAGTAVLAVVIFDTESKVSAGTIVALITLIGMLATPLRDLGRVYEYWLNVIVSRNNLKRFFQDTAHNKKTRNKKLKTARGHISVEKLTLFEGAPEINAEILPGRRIALLGMNGSGKSTLLLAIAGLREPASGHIYLDGADVLRLNGSSARRSIGIVSDLLPLMQGSLDKNLRYRHPRATSQDVEKVIDECQLEHLIESLPEGKKSRLTREGLNLSLGERRRVALARALLGTPELLLLDEIESNLDSHFTHELQNLLGNYPGTIIHATHNEEMAMQADEIWVLSNGDIVIQDNPDHFSHELDELHSLFSLHKEANQG